MNSSNVNALSSSTRKEPDYDAVVVGAGFAGLYMLYRLRELGMSTLVYDDGDDVGGTWFWNRYPGARCDTESHYYCYSFSKDLLQDWNWPERYSAQPDIHRYFQHLADRFDLRRHIQFNTRVESAVFDDVTNCWWITTGEGERVCAKYFITGTGLMSATYTPNFKGIRSFGGLAYHTARWPHEPVDFSGKRVAVIGTGSTGVSVIPSIAKQAKQLTVFQRTPNFVTPARNRANQPEHLQQIKENYDEIWRKTQTNFFGLAYAPTQKKALDVSPEERRQRYEAAWAEGGFGFMFNAFDDLMTDEGANETAAEFIRAKIRETVKDQNVAERLTPRGYPFGGKRPPIGIDYYETFNRDNVKLIDVRATPIEEITPQGIRTSADEYAFDAIVFATGFDAMTGSLMRIDIRGKNGVELKQQWNEGPRSYLGMVTHNFPNMFMINGPGSAYVNGPVVIETCVNWISGCLSYMQKNNYSRAESRAVADGDWADQAFKAAYETVMPLGEKANSWFTGANIPGKPLVVNVYLGGNPRYREHCLNSTARNYADLEFIV